MSTSKILYLLKTFFNAFVILYSTNIHIFFRFAFEFSSLSEETSCRQAGMPTKSLRWRRVMYFDLATKAFVLAGYTNYMNHRAKPIAYFDRLA